VTADLAFDLSLEHGRCIGVRIPAADAALDALVSALPSPEERARAAGLPRPRRRSWVGGRIAMRTALEHLGMRVDAVPSDDRGAPVVPPGVSGSITHKDVPNEGTLAAALVAREPHARIGIDLELDVPRSQDIATRVLTEGELAEVAHLEAGERAREVLLRFSAKEAIYKALDPFVRRYVAFDEVAVIPRSDGTAVVTTGLRLEEGPFVIDVRWQRFDGIILTTARVVLAG
jgi:enterobactin synthetase component D